MSIEALKEELSKLTRMEQAELMHFMIEMLTSNEFQLTEEWKDELDRRESALKDGTSVGRPARDVIAKYKPQ